MSYRSLILSALVISLVAISGATISYAGTLSCSVTTAAACISPSVIVLRMSGSSDAHAELPSQSTAAYAGNVICCTGVTGLGNSCSGTFAVVAKLASTTNSHLQQNDQTGYANNACISVSSGSVSVGYQATNCLAPTAYDTTLGSLSAATNAHVGNTTAYPTDLICATAAAAAQSLTFSISDNSIGFGTLSSSLPRYATGDTVGTSTETEAHQLSVSTNASSGYVVTVQGSTLSSGSFSISPNSTNTASVTGTEQFGLRIVASGGSGTVSAPYAASGFAYAATATTSNQVASASATDSGTTYSVRYIGNIAGNTETGSYSTSLTYVATANF